LNNTCPSCGAIYNVASKDIGRKIKCKKCGASLEVTETGLEEEGSGAPASERKPAPDPVEDDDRGDEEDRPSKKKKDRERYSGPRTNPLEAVGGIPTVLFGFGVFLVIVFTAMPIIGLAGTDRAKAYVDKLKNDQASKKKALFPKNKKITDLTDSERNKIREDGEKIDEDYAKKLDDAELEASSTAVSNRRDVWMEQYGLMFGFIFVSFGCIAYIRSDQGLILRIVAAAILFVMMIIMFGKFGGCAIK
jgi:predicted Zn finger-like uncharacterized protein